MASPAHSLRFFRSVFFMENKGSLGAAQLNLPPSFIHRTDNAGVTGRATWVPRSRVLYSVGIWKKKRNCHGLRSWISITCSILKRIVWTSVVMMLLVTVYSSPCVDGCRQASITPYCLMNYISKKCFSLQVGRSLKLYNALEHNMLLL